MQKLQPIFFVLFCVLFSGCGNQLPLGGKVTFSDDGSPLSLGTVVFEKGDFSAVGRIKPDGTYTVGSFKENDGLPAGVYKVCVIGAILREPVPGSSPTGDLIDSKFTSTKTSELTFEVSPKNRTFDFSVDRYQSK